MPDNSTDANTNGNDNGQAEDSGRDADDTDKTTNNSSKRRRRSNTNDNDDDDEAKVDKDITDADEEQQTQAEEQKDKEDSIQLGQKTPIRTKTYDGGSTSTSRDNATDSRRTNDPWPRDCNGRRRTRLSTEQHVSTILDNLNLNGEG